MLVTDVIDARDVYVFVSDFTVSNDQ